MTSLLLSFLASPKVVGALVAIGGFLAAVLTAFLKGRASGAAKENAKRLAEQQRAQEAALNMQQEGHTLTVDAQKLSDEQARKEALKWTRK